MHCPNCRAFNAPSNTFCEQCGFALNGATPSSTPQTGRLGQQTLLNGRYLILRKIADGGFSAVYLAEDTRLGQRRVAVKEMVVALGGQDPLLVQQAIADFHREAELLARLHHRNLPRVIDYFEEGGRHFLVMDFINGQTLREVQQATRGPLPEVQVLDWAAQVGDVLHLLHTQQPPIIYRDVKPENVMLEPDGTLKLLDFGIARFHKLGNSTDTVALGTPGYAAPEQFGKGQSDERTDIYALGAMLYELLTGHDVSTTPFTFLPARQRNPQLSIRVEGALTQATQSDPAQRFASVKAFCLALGTPTFVTNPASTPRPATVVIPPSPIATPVKRWSVRSVLLIGLVLLGAVGTGGGMLLAFNGTTATPTPQVVVQATAAAPTDSSDPANNAPSQQVTAVTSATDPAATTAPQAAAGAAVTTAPLAASDTPTPTPISTPSPTPSLTPTPSEEDRQREVEAALLNYNERRAEALRTSNAAIFDEITSGEQRNKELRTISSDLATGAHHDITIFAWRVDRVEFPNPFEALVEITKTEDRLFYPSGCSVPDDTSPCRRSPNQQNTKRNETYSVRYRLLRLDDRWKIDATEVLP